MAVTITADFTATIDRGDGTATAGTIVGLANGSLTTSATVDGAHTYAADGTYPLQVIINDRGGAAATAATTVTVDQPITAANLSLSGTVVLENSGTANGGQNTSAPLTFTITVNQVNLPPSFTLASPSVTVGENSGPQYVAGIAGDIVPGQPGESATGANGTSNLQFQISESNPGLLDPPAIDSQGNLTFTPATNQSGSDTITVQLQDTSQTAGGGTNVGAPQTFTVNVAPGGQTVSELHVKSIEPTSSGFVATFDN